MTAALCPLGSHLLYANRRPDWREEWRAHLAGCKECQWWIELWRHDRQETEEQKAKMDQESEK